MGEGGLQRKKGVMCVCMCGCGWLGGWQAVVEMSPDSWQGLACLS